MTESEASGTVLGKHSLLLCTASSPVFPSLKRLFPVVIVSFVLSSCYSPQTKAPHQIDAIELTEENIYSKMDCDSLLEAREEEKDELIVLREKQVIKRQDDTMRMMNWGIIGGAIASRNAQDWEEEIGLSKGKLLAIQKEIDSRCLLDEEEKKRHNEEISLFFYNEAETELDRLLADAAKFYFEEP
ncbi:MAG: hypothetical protein F4162_03695 [Synechococcus sp. SB0676_bin_10]|uniref:Uncharacterized protein n=1 Tax=Synechococcus sp. SB0676_bin_10 TaxID=2604869 RepID=A0A6B1F6Y4_9SYNE|nr:hypothetical protein [Synechococcus sp. SB0676_bin_10]